MSSILKVDTIQTTAGAAPTTKDLGFAGGAVIQVVQGALSSDVNYASSSTIEVLSVNITPKFNTSKILLMGNWGHYLNGSTTTDRGDYVFRRDSTDIFRTGIGGFGYFRSSGYIKSMNNSHNYLDSPATTSSITYKLVHTVNTYGSGGTFGAPLTNLTLLEISQ